MNSLLSKKIPTLFGLVAITIGIGITSFLTKEGAIFTGQASPTDVPDNVQISNVSDTSFTVSYTTTDSVIGSLNVGENASLGTTILDERDNTPTAHNSHFITVKNLKPQTTYLFSITSGQNTYLNNGAPYNIKTGALLNPVASTQRGNVSGKVILPDGKDAPDIIVTISTKDAQNLSTITRGDGSYNIGLNLIRKSDLSTYYELPQRSVLKLTLTSDSLSSIASLTVDEANFVPTITLSSNYDFRINSAPIDTTEVSSPSANIVFPTATPSAKTNTTPQLLTPKKDQGFSDDQPTFKGTALPNQSVEITIHSDQEINTTVTSDSNGNWSYRPDSSLTPGIHTISITTKDAFGIFKTITQQFTVYASGTQVDDNATPSATLTPTNAPTLAPTATITASETPTIAEIPTSAPTAILPPSGSSTAEAFGIFGIALIIIGSILFILIHVV